MPITTSYFLIFFFKKKVSAENGPSTFNPFFFKYFIDGIIILSSSLNLSIVSQCGFKPKTAILIFFLKFFYKNYLFLKYYLLFFFLLFFLKHI